MDDNSEDEKENYSLLDQKRKEEIILELKKEINDQILINSNSKDEKIIDTKNSETEELFKQMNDIISNKNESNLNNNQLNYDSNLLFNEINNFIKDKNTNDKEKYIINNKESKEYESLPFPTVQLENLILNKQNKIEKENKKINDIKIKYNTNINNKKNLLFNYNKSKPTRLKCNNSFNETKKFLNKNRKINKDIKTQIVKAKSTEKIKNNKNKIKTIKSYKHKIIPNAKSKEKFKNIQIEINKKFKEEHPFQPKINTKKNNSNIKIINETKEQKYIRLSRPKIFEVKGIHLLKTEESKLQTPNKINKIKTHNKIDTNQISNRLYKLHQQIKEKKEHVKKIFDKKEMDKCSFNPEINNVSKKIMNKTYNNISFNERNENYIKHKKESLLKLRKEIDKEINEKCSNKINNKNETKNTENTNEVNVYDRLYENKYYSNMININTDRNDFYKTMAQKNNYMEIQNFLERQKIYEDIKKEHINKFKYENNLNTKNEKEELTFKPKINSTSELIAKTNPERNNEETNDKYQRLYEEAELIKNRKEQLTEFYNAQYNFTPQINEISKLIVNNCLTHKNSVSSINTINTLNNNLILEQNECTFKPRIIYNEKYNSIESNYKYDENISKKIEEEISNRNNKMNKLKSEYFNNNVKECKFVPETNKNIYNLKMYYSNNDNYYQKGLKKHLDQMDKAKKAKQEKEEREKKVFITGENWNCEKICFKPFNLSKTNKSKNIDKIREEIKNEEMKECSFQPITNETIKKNIVKKILDENIK